MLHAFEGIHENWIKLVVSIIFMNYWSNVSYNKFYSEAHQALVSLFQSLKPQFCMDLITPFSKGCYSYVGMRGGGQTVNLEPGCFKIMTTVQHEILHALGFEHMFTTATRDNYLQILFQNVQPDMIHNFEINPTSDLFGTPYDY